MTAVIPHTAIRASAGSGKTYQLAHRYIRLLALDEGVERIIALTFSRKAAGEIFDAIALRLCDAATDAGVAAATADAIARPELGPDDFLDLLVGFVRDMHRLRIGTIDSFTVQILRMFPLELGLGLDVAMMDNGGAAAAAAREAVLAGIFSGRAVTADDQAQFLQAFKLATFGHEEKAVSRPIDAFIQPLHRHYRILPGAAGWGVSDPVWPGGFPWRIAHGEQWPEVLARVGDGLATGEWTDAALKAWRRLIGAFADYAPGRPIPDKQEGSALFKAVMSAWDDLGSGSASITFNRREYAVNPRLANALQDAFSHIIGSEIGLAMARTAGIRRLLAQYDTVYEQSMRHAGRLTFDDAQHILGGRIRGAASRIQSPRRLAVDERLDARFDHWLLDEFQDTSEAQWRVLEHLVEEVVSDPARQRSFFFVGDVKQAIYGWRGGDANLFQAVLDRYGKAIEEQDLSVSYRSGPAIIDTVNRAFGRLPDFIPAATARTWASTWSTHEPTPLEALSGEVAWYDVDEARPRSSQPTEGRLAAVAEWIRELDPIRRGLSVAVLVRTNDSGAAVVQVLRSAMPDLPVVHEGSTPITDNPVVRVLLALLQRAVHPGDALAGAHLRMSPLGDAAQQASFSTTILDRVADEGFHGFIRHWGEVLATAGAMDAFSTKRWQELLGAAAVFDAGGERDVDGFIRHVESHTVQESAADRAVRVMTIHQSKGLGFDVVVLPELQGRNFSGGAVKNVVHRKGALDPPEWILRMPRRVFAERDAVLRRALEEVDAESAFESLCVLYVAMTRARRSMVLFTSGVTNGKPTSDGMGLLRENLVADGGGSDPWMEGVDLPLACMYRAGERDWIADCPVGEPEQSPQRDAAPRAVAPARPRERTGPVVRPSQLAPHGLRIGELLDDAMEQSRRHGIAVHHLMEQIEWLDETDLDALIAGWQSSAAFTDAECAGAAEEVRGALGDMTIRELLVRPNQAASVWRERTFDCVLPDGGRVHGIIDRLVVADDRSSAQIIDFKTNASHAPEALAAVAARYSAQLDAYARAVHSLFGVPEEAIERILVFTAVKHVVRTTGA